MDVHLEQRVNIKFCVKLGKTATQICELLCDDYGNKTLSRERVFERHKRFVSRRTSVEDDTRQGRPATSRNENVARIREIAQQDCTITVRMLSDALDISKTTCHQILRETLGKRKLNARLLPHSLTEDQKDTLASVSAKLLSKAEKDAAFVDSIIAEDETWCFQYDLQTKRQSAEWRSTSSPASRKVQRQKTKTKTMLIVFFDARGVIHHEFVPQGQTVKQEFYICVLQHV
ncbi:protein GVQW3-like [Dermacentor andersoni]|uniref:protein GVQW3-like n=1 Tax=Dermacentor andersoni TaxID=34620 RepID=UPI002155EFA0|nr:protein GVQW3-like [Dermacentor andersoni]